MQVVFSANERRVVEQPYYLPSGNENGMFKMARRQRLPLMLKGPTGFGKTPPVEQCLADRLNLRVALGYYRAFFDPASFSFAYVHGAGILVQPLLYLHGAPTGASGLIRRRRPRRSRGPGPGSSTVLVPETGHFLHLEAPEFVSQQIIGFIP